MLNRGVGASSVMLVDASGYEIHSQVKGRLSSTFLLNMSFLTALPVQRSFFFCYDARHQAVTLFISLKMQHPTEPQHEIRPLKGTKKDPAKSRVKNRD
ncbi:hypothetical protein [Pseudomonas sp. SLFW]|uniref:hypothetical protein n=1 Tax=Pseudomonas sp. SLFW TaxID=2683259 RepID=UPI0014121606|nr:hypothetical protein [Pseudomonas sp. SLFW]NBB09425.1 hypothetical protein [Pseudomonas sp. SLFW]